MGSQTITSLDAIAEVQKYTLISDDIFLREFDASNVPDWYKTMVDNAISNSATINDLASLINMLQGIVDGYTMRLYSVETSNENMHTLLTTLSSSLGAAQAAILNLDITKVTPTEALAISREVVGAYFNSDAGAWFDSKITAYASAVEAFASNISTLAAVLGNQTVRLDTIDSVLVTTEGWAASASKLITAPDGSITGWSFGDGSGIQSQFKVYADNFVIQGAAVPIEYDNSAIVLPKTYEQSSAPTSGMLIGDTWIDTDDNNKVYTYTSTGWKASVSNKTFAQTTQPTTGMITNDIWYDTDDNNKPYYYTGSGWSAIRDGTIAIAQATADSKTTLAAVQAQGYVVPSGVAEAINNNTTTINGSKITTGSISALQIAAGSITASKLDVNALSGVKGLFTRATNPAAGDYGEALAAIQQSGTWCLSGRNDTSSGDAVGVAGASTASSTGIGVYGHSKAYGVVGSTTSGTGQWGLFTNQKAYAGGGYVPFTGSHIVYSKGILEVGDICSVADSWVINVNQTCVWVDKTMVANDKKVIGVVSYPNSPLLTNIEHNPLFTDKLEDATYSYKPEYLDFITGMIEDNFTEVCINSLGEGAINVNSENGNIEIGDYICSSNIPGKGMKQNDDILHNYTVAKALESVDWTTEQSTTKMIACTYHCG